MQKVCQNLEYMAKEGIDRSSDAKPFFKIVEFSRFFSPSFLFSKNSCDNDSWAEVLFAIK